MWDHCRVADASRVAVSAFEYCLHPGAYGACTSGPSQRHAGRRAPHGTCPCTLTASRPARHRRLPRRPCLAPADAADAHTLAALAWCAAVPNARCPVPSAQCCPVSGAVCPVPCAQCRVPNAQCAPMPYAQLIAPRCGAVRWGARGARPGACHPYECETADLCDGRARVAAVRLPLPASRLKKAARAACLCLAVSP